MERNKVQGKRRYSTGRYMVKTGSVGAGEIMKRTGAGGAHRSSQKTGKFAWALRRIWKYVKVCVTGTGKIIAWAVVTGAGYAFRGIKAACKGFPGAAKKAWGFLKSLMNGTYREKKNAERENLASDGSTPDGESFAGRAWEFIKKSAAAVWNFTVKAVRWTLGMLDKVSRRLGVLFIPSAVLAVIAIISAVNFVNQYTVAMNVFLDNEKIACVTSEENFENMVAAFENRVSYELGTNYKTDIDVFYQFTFVKEDELNDDIALEDKLLERISDEIREMAVLSIDGVIIGANEDIDGVNNMVNEIKSEYLEGYEVEVAEFEKDVKVETRLCWASDSTPINKMKAYMTQPLQEEVMYSVEQGDTVWAIATQYGMSPDELLNMNPQLGDGSNLKVGQELRVSAEVPMISVATYRVVEYEDEIPYETQVEYDDGMYKNQSKVRIAGVKGKQWVKAEIKLVDGNETERRILEATELSAPSTEVIVKGTKELPPTAPTGTFRRPTSGIITATFGKRGKRWSSVHTGIDIANSYGTSIYAADGGKVINAGWKGSYGKCIIIDHGNGRKTLYGHLSSIAVSVGDEVAKGAYIGGMGKTGNASGVHLHFEIIINGTQKNPANYVSF